MIYRRLRRATFLGGVAIAVAVGVANAYVLLSVGSESTDDVGEVPPAQVAIVLGALVKPNGEMSLMLADRVERAIELWRAGRIDRVLVSGDHGRHAYDEPGTMRAALVEAGVPPGAVFEDHAGFDTWATMARAREIFGVRDAVIVTQGFHMPRALYLAEEAGIEATGLTADLHPYGAQGSKSSLREALSRVKAIADTTFDRAALGGEPISLSGDGRSTWGPATPPG